MWSEVGLTDAFNKSTNASKMTGIEGKVYDTFIFGNTGATLADSSIWMNMAFGSGESLAQAALLTGNTVVEIDDKHYILDTGYPYSDHQWPR